MLLMKFLIVIFISIPSASLLATRGINVGTVLFAPSDAHKECWSAETLALLTARMVMEGILPDRKCLDVNDEQIINDIIEYFRLILEVVRKNTTGKIKHIMLLALTDALGGYMKHYFLPIAKYAYYAGNVNYNGVIRVHQLYDEIKNYLRTNGAGWTKPPSDIGKDVVAQPLQIQTTKHIDYCKGLMYTQTSGKRRSSGNRIEIAMPYFDSHTRPSAIAVPFKSYSLRNVEAKCAAYILVKFYIASSKCMASKDVSLSSIQDFNSNLFAFIINKVEPHFCDERFYAAFGGVLRIVETMKQSGYIKNGKVIGSYNIMPEMEDKEHMKDPASLEDEEAVEKGAAGKGDGKMLPEERAKRSKANLLVLAALATIIIWFFLGACFVCCRIRSAKKKADDQMKLLEGGDGKSGTTKSSSKRCLSSMSSKTKCSTMSGKSATCNRETCANFSSSSISGPNAKSQAYSSETASASSKTSKSSVSESGSTKSGSPSKTTDDSVSEDKTTPRHSPKAMESPITVQTAQYYPATFACHSSMSGKYKAGSSSEEFSSKSTIKKPFVFGYDFQTTSEESSPRIGESITRLRRKSVFEASFNPEDDENEEKVVFPKSHKETIQLNDALKNILIFRSLDEEQLQEVVNVMFEVQVNAGDVIIKQGDNGDFFYVVRKGIFQAWISEIVGHEPALVYTYENSGNFGELALLYDTPRAATIKAVTNGALWAMDRENFKRIVRKSAYEKRKMYEYLLENVPMLMMLDPYERSNVADALVSKTYKPGERIIKQGDEGDGMYFIESGSVTVKISKNGTEHEVNHIDTGGYFGELALINHGPRAASVYAKNQVKLAFLDVAAFERLLGPCVALMRRNTLQYENHL